MGGLDTSLSIAGWAFIPDYATGILVRYMHSYVFAKWLKITPPQPGTRQYQNHIRWTFAVAVLGFLLYNMISSAQSMRPSFYELMGVGPSVDEAGLKQAFRQFARKYHPDRVGPQGEAVFIAVRDAFEALKDPVKRYAYDRFGPDVLTWTNCSTPREFIRRGLTQSVGFHVVSLLGILFWSAVGSTPLPYWRYTLYFACFATELSLIVNPSPSPTSSNSIFQIFLPSRVQYQHIQYLHQILVFLNVALGRVAPRLFPDDLVSQDIAALQSLRTLIIAASSEVDNLFVHEFKTIAPPSDVPVDLQNPNPSTRQFIDDLSLEMENLIIESNLQKDSGPLKSAWDRAIDRGRRAISISHSSSDPSSMSVLRAVDGGVTSLPSPVSPRATPEPEARESSRQSSPWKQRLKPLSRSPSYVRARSQSL
ncbi:hypothetical protein DL96DRAFT_1710124 [Flagelloscypha sp. PMI_526]|nr:hypothetical protein DL96DRAFT_1710124 [Flagelloscypha sp. PMI_526]